MTVEVITAPLLTGVSHGFLGRRGGVSGGLVAGLNCGIGSGDDAVAVAQNRRLAVAAVAPGARLVTVYQVHSPDVVVAGDWNDAARPRADALVTDRRDIALGIVTADCAPVLFADRDAGVIAAAHAGWKGAVAGVTDNTVAAMVALGARRDRIVAAVGPCIAQASYEVDAAFHARFDDARFLAPGARPGHWQFDLAAYVLARLAAAGVRAEALHYDTYADPARFYSYRRATHRGEADYGRQMAIIAR